MSRFRSIYFGPLYTGGSEWGQGIILTAIHISEILTLGYIAAYIEGEIVSLGKQDENIPFNVQDKYAFPPVIKFRKQIYLLFAYEI